MLRATFCSIWDVFNEIQPKPRKTAQTEQNVALSIQAHCFCDYSATNKPILDFSKDSESLGRPLDDSVGADVRKCPKAHPRSQNVRICPNMFENVRILIFGQIRTFSDTVEQEKTKFVEFWSVGVQGLSIRLTLSVLREKVERQIFCSAISKSGAFSDIFGHFRTYSDIFGHLASLQEKNRTYSDIHTYTIVKRTT